MYKIKHIEKHSTASELVRDVVIGMSDGLTVPFALAAGLSGAAASSGLIVTGGLAEIAAGAIAMGLGGYLAAKSDRDHYLNEKRREAEEVVEKPDQEKYEVEELFKGYGLTDQQIAPILQAFQADHQAWVNFMMRFELGLEEPDPKRARASAIAISSSYTVGGLVPLAPYMILPDVQAALLWSCLLTLAALLVFGYSKAKFTGNKPAKSAIQTLIIGTLAAGAAYAIARLVSHQ